MAIGPGGKGVREQGDEWVRHIDEVIEQRREQRGVASTEVVTLERDVPDDVIAYLRDQYEAAGWGSVTFEKFYGSVSIRLER